MDSVDPVAIQPLYSLERREAECLDSDDPVAIHSRLCGIAYVERMCVLEVAALKLGRLISKDR